MRPLAILASLLMSTLLTASCGGGGGGGSGRDPNRPPADGGPGGTVAASKVFVSGTAAGAAAQVASYANTSFATGALDADRVISGASTGLDAPANGGPRGLAGDAENDRLFAVNIDDNSILVFDNASRADGNLAPSRKIAGSSTLLDIPVFLFLDVVNDRLYVSNFGPSHSVLVFDNASTVSGNVVPSRIISGFTLQPFSQLTGIHVDVANNTLYVADLGAGAIYAFNNAATIDSRTALASRVITGASTSMSAPRGLVADSAGDRLYVTTMTGGGRILVFDNASTATGNISPSRTIATAAALFEPASLYLDAARDRLYATSPGANSLDYFDDAGTANGIVAAAGAADLTGVSAPFGIFVDTR